MSDTGKERRKFDRIPSDMEVRFEVVGSGESHIGKLVDMNGTGVCFESGHDIPVDSEVQVVTVDDGEVVPILDGVMQVLRVIEKDGKFLVAGAFKDLKT